MERFGREVVDLTVDDDYVMIDKSDFLFQPSSPSPKGFTSPQKVSSKRPFTRSPFWPYPTKPPASKSSLSGPSSRRTSLFSSTASETSNGQVAITHELSRSTWSFPLEFSRSYSSATSKSESPISNQGDRRPSKRSSASFLHDDSESPPKRRNTGVIEISSDSEDDYVFLPRHQSMSMRGPQVFSDSRRASTASRDLTPANNANEIIEIDLDEEEGILFDENDIFVEIPSTHVSKSGARQTSMPSKKSLAPRNPPLESPWTSIPMKVHKDMELRALETVELKDGDFLRIKMILEQPFTGDITIRGWRLRRAHKMEAQVPHKLNEVCWLFDEDLDDPRPLLEQSVDEVSVDEVVKLRDLRATNQKFPACRFEPLIYQRYGKEWVYQNSELVVRWKYITTFDSARDRVNCKFSDRRLEFLRENDCAEHLGICDEVRRRVFNETMICGGSSQAVKKHIKALRKNIVEIDEDGSLSFYETRRKSSGKQDWSEPADTYSIEDYMSTMSLADQNLNQRRSTSISLDSQRRAIDLVSSNIDAFEAGGILTGSHVTLPRRYKRKSGQKYTYGDFFSGAGGASRGAKLAGLDLIYGLDFWDIANKTYKENFPGTKVYQMASDQFIMELVNISSLEFYVDILHMSPPCQYWSPAHTRPGKDDERNMAALFSVLGLLTVVKPRMATLEQTFGLHTPYFRPYFNTLVNMFTSLGYSVRWSIVPLADWGLPQSRKRLIMIASAPGETLPSFPPRTHSKEGEGGLKRHVTINDALRRIPRDALDHDVEAAEISSMGKYLPAYDGNILAKTITTSGGGNYHPSGRWYTVRELACLQTFPLDHQFRGPYVKKQIGNAVPPIALGKILFSHLRKHLEHFDGVVQDAISLDD